MKPPFWTRYLFITVVCSLIAVGVIIQMIRVQNISGAEEIMLQSEAYAGTTETIIPDRGNIYDRKGAMLAGNETTYEIGLDLMQISDPETIATAVSSILGLDYFETLAYANLEPGQDGRYYIVLDDFIPSDKIEQLKILEEDYQTREIKRDEIRPSLSGLIWAAHTKRSYPEGSLASNILGFYGFLDRTEGRGFFGVEEAYDDLLAGTLTDVYVSYDPQLVEALPDVPKGADLILTIDREIQAMTENVLDEAVDWSGAEAGTIIISDPEDGSILAMATTPRLDPNSYWTYDEVFPKPTPFNRAVSQSYEPGSVFKVLTMAAALDAGAVTPDTIFTDTGSIMVGGVPIYNWNYGGWGDQNMTGCLQHSLNVCLAWVATELGEDAFYQYMRNFGLDRNTGVDLAGEIHWPLRVPGDNQWFEVDLATNSFGQGIAVTPIQMVMAVSALANDGKMMSPHIVKSMIIDDHQYEINPVVVGTPIRAETAQTITEMLAVSLEEEASIALVEGYRVAGKTGTAEIATEFGYTSSTTNTSFVGWGPAEDPQFLVYIWLEKPTISIWGSEVAAPVFSDLVEKLVVLMDIPPDSIRLNLASE
jgi:cell division protein FtsI/penicillin-binding protein 2